MRPAASARTLDSAPDRLASLWVERRGALYSAVGESKRAWPGIETTNVIGYGIAGHLAACVLAASQRGDAGLLRPRRKPHGTRRRLEGAFSRWPDTTVVSTESNLLECRRACRAVGLLGVRHLVVDLRAGDSNHTYTARPPAPESACVQQGEKGVERLEGSFLLSSGARSKVYYDTFAAASCYARVERVCRERSSLLRAFDALVGVANGGTYFGVVAALLTGKTPMTVDPSSAETALVHDGGRDGDGAVLFFEDYVTTGGSIVKARRLLGAGAPSAPARFLSLYAPQNAGDLRTPGDIVERLPA